MSLADIRIALLFVTVIAVTAIFSSVFGIRGLYFILSVHTIMNFFFITVSLIANGKI